MIGTGTFLPSAKFSPMRAWMTRFAFSDILLPGHQVANGFVFLPPLDAAHSYNVILNPTWYAWTSNFYTLDFIVTEAYRVELATGIHTPMDFTLDYHVFPSPIGAVIGFRNFGTYTPNAYFPLPSQPSGYWLPGL